MPNTSPGASNAAFAAQLSRRHRIGPQSEEGNVADNAQARSLRPALTYAMTPPQAPQETPALNRSGQEAADTGQRMARKGAAAQTAPDAHAVAARVYELMREEARLARLRGAWWRGR